MNDAGWSFSDDAVAVEVDGDDLTLCIDLHLDITSRLQRVVLALGARQHARRQYAVIFVLFECELELAGFQQRALEHDVVDQTCLTDSTRCLDTSLQCTQLDLFHLHRRCDEALFRITNS